MIDKTLSLHIWNAGTAVKLSDSFNHGVLGGIGVGYKFVKGRIAFMPSAGYKIQKIQEGKAIIVVPSTGQAESISSEIYLNTLSFRLGILF